MLGVGRFLRQQYGHFLTNDLREVNLMSSAAERCQATGQFTVNGAYPADQANKIRPIPMRVDSVSGSNVLNDTKLVLPITVCY